MLKRSFGIWSRSFATASVVASALLASACSGDDGTNGAQGDTGIDGENGADGTDGENGSDGENGADGVDGDNGVDGMDGENGTDGVDGENGTDGENGVDGMDGENGADGVDGADGENGLDGADGANGAPGVPRATIYLSNNGPDNAGTVERLTQSSAVTKWFEPGNNEGIDFLASGDLIQAGDTAAGPSLRTFCAPETRSNGAIYVDGVDRAIEGSATELVNPKGIAIARQAGYVLVANNGDDSIKVFGTAAAGNVAPAATTNLDGNPWDLAYDEVNDRLFVALTNGTLAVFDDYIASGFSSPASRTITPVDASDEQISVNLHGIVYHRHSDRLVVSDVGDAASAEDGALFVVEGASSVDGDVEPSRVIAGPSTLLGNPVDLVLTDADLRVAEKAGDTLLTFSSIFDGPSGDIAPDHVAASVKPESLAVFEPSWTPASAVSDISDSSLTVPYLGVTSNPGPDSATTGLIARITSSLGATGGEFDAGINLESLTFDHNGDVVATFDDVATSAGGIFIGNRVATSRDGETMTNSRDRMIIGDATGLIMPKGLDLDSTLGVIMVAEFNASSPSVLVFSTCATGNVAPLASTSTGGARPWDVDYDGVTDRLYVAFTNGTVGVYDQFRSNWGVDGPDRLITPADAGAQISVNLHGVDYDPGSDSLLLSDVGDAADATDGQLFVIPGAGSADGLTQVTVQFGGPATNLGNPVDVAYDGQHLYVAEKSNDVILRFDSIIESVGGDAPASLSFAFTKPESVALNPAYLWQMR